MVVDMQWYVPLSETFEDVQAVDRLQAFQVHWYASQFIIISFDYLAWHEIYKPVTHTSTPISYLFNQIKLQQCIDAFHQT